MRKPFDTTCDVYKGPGTTTPGLFVGTFPCRYVREDGIFAIGNGHVPIPAYMTIEGYTPVGFWTVPFLGVDASLADQIAIPSGNVPMFWVIYTDVIVWHVQPAYYRAYLAFLPFPGPGTVGGLEFNGSALVSTIPPFVAYGGLEFNGSALVSTIPPFLAYGGLLLDGDTLDEITRMRFIDTSGGLELNGVASWSFTPGPTDYIRDTFTDTSGTGIASHTPEVGGPWTVVTGGPQVISNSFQGNTYTSGSAIASIDPGHADYTLTVDFTVPGGQSYLTDYPLLILRYTDPSNCWYVYFFNGFFYLQCYVAGVATVTQLVNPMLIAGVTYTVTIVVSSSTGITATIGIYSVSSGVSTWSSVTPIALQIFANGGSNVGVKFDNLLVVP